MGKSDFRSPSLRALSLIHYWMPPDFISCQLQDDRAASNYSTLPKEFPGYHLIVFLVYYIVNRHGQSSLSTWCYSAFFLVSYGKDNDVNFAVLVKLNIVIFNGLLRKRNRRFVLK